MEDGVFSQEEKSNSEPIRISSVSLLCGGTEEREVSVGYTGVELRETFQWLL
jgi:hypothetical protein